MSEGYWADAMNAWLEKLGYIPDEPQEWFEGGYEAVDATLRAQLAAAEAEKKRIADSLAYVNGERRKVETSYIEMERERNTLRQHLATTEVALAEALRRCVLVERFWGEYFEGRQAQYSVTYANLATAVSSLKSCLEEAGAATPRAQALGAVVEASESAAVDFQRWKDDTRDDRDVDEVLAPWLTAVAALLELDPRATGKEGGSDA